MPSAFVREVPYRQPPANEGASPTYSAVAPAVLGGGGTVNRVVLNPAGHSTLPAVALTDYVVNAHAGFTQTLPTAVGNTGRYSVKNIDAAGSGTASIGTTSSQTIEGTVAPITIQPGQSLDLISDNANWNLY